jgi:cell division protein FtsQ
MKNQTLLSMVWHFFSRKKNAGGGMSQLSQKISGQGYQAKHLGSVVRKKGLKERWLARRHTKLQTGANPKQQHGEGSRQKKLYIAVLALIIVFVGSVLLTGPLQTVLHKVKTFRIHDVNISGCVMTNSKELRKFAGISYELNMLTLNPKQIREKLLTHPWIAEVEIRRIWPDRLAVAVKEFRPTALVVLGGEGANVLKYMDGRGHIFATVQRGQEIDFPVITGLDGSAKAVQNQEILEAVTLFLRLAGRNNPNLPAQNISEVHLDGDGGLTLYLVEHPFPIFFGKGEIRRKFSQLREVLEELYRKKRGKAMIDEIAYIRMDYQENKVLVAKKKAGKRHG